MYATNASGSFVTTTLVDVGNNASTGPTVDDTDLELDSSGNVHISYQYEDTDGNFSLRHLTNTGGSFGSPTTVVNNNELRFVIASAINGAADRKIIIYRNFGPSLDSIPCINSTGY